MSWEFSYDADNNVTTIYWDGDEQGLIDGKITEWQNGYPMGEARNVVSDAIQSAGTPDRIRMQYDFNYGFGRRDGSDPS